MLTVKILERKEVIRFFGIALMVAPIMNFIISVSQIPRPDKWHGAILWQAWTLLPLPKKILAGAGLLIGILMLQGSKAAWKYTMVLIGGHLFFQIMNFGQNVRESWLAIPTFLINIGVFLFIADQLVWKQPKAPAANAIPPVAPKPIHSLSTAEKSTASVIQMAPVVTLPRSANIWTQTEKSVRVDFDGFGPWAKLVSISGQDIVMRSLVNEPPVLEGRILEVILPGGVLLQARFVKRAADLFYFESSKPAQQDISKINDWLRSKAA